MPEAAAFRVDLSASRLARRLRAAARWLTVAAAVACALAAVLAPSAARIGATLASIGAVVLVFIPGRTAAARRLAVDGEAKISAGAGGTWQPAAVRYFGRHFVCLQTPDGLLGVWPDSMSGAHWRRLRVACRWQHAERVDGTASPSGLRTK